MFWGEEGGTYRLNALEVALLAENALPRPLVVAVPRQEVGLWFRCQNMMPDESMERGQTVPWIFIVWFMCTTTKSS